MAEVLLFHHAQGQTAGFFAFADELRRAGHAVHTPDLYEGRTFDSLEDGLANVEAIGFETIVERGVRAAEDLPAELVYAGFSLGVVPAQLMAQNRPGASAARALVAQAEQAELFLYPGEQHLFADSSLPSYDADAAALLTRRVLEFLANR